jgi:hypothetical protein
MRIEFGMLLGVFAATGAAAQDRIDLPVRPNVTQPVYATMVAKPAASLILFPGGSGVVAAVRSNFLLRIVPDLVRQGFSVYAADTPSDHPGGMTTSFRLSPEHADGIAAIVAYAKTQSPAPVWLVGTSRGSVSAANGAFRLGRSVSGAVLTSSVWANGMAGIPFDRLTVPVLIVHNRDDGCQDSPFVGAERTILQVTAPHELVAVSGGTTRGDACGGRSPHGYLGIEDKVISPMVAFIKTH